MEKNVLICWKLIVTLNAVRGTEVLITVQSEMVTECES